MCERHPTNAPSGADLVVTYIPFSDYSGLEITLLPGLYRIPIKPPAEGVVKLASVYRYSCGPHVPGANSGFPFGLMYLISTLNGTVVSQNPADTAFPARYLVLTRDENNASQAGLFDRTNTPVTLPISTGFDFGAVRAMRIRVGVVGFRGAGTASSYELYGSNNIPGGFSEATIASNTAWTLLANAVNMGTLSTDFTLGSSLDTATYWRYLKIRRTTGGSNQLTELEFYESTIETPHVNFFT